MSEKFPSQMQDKFTVRFPDGMRDVIAEMAKNDGRSINSEIIALLELAIRVCRDFGPDDGPVVQQFRERLSALDKKSDDIEKTVTLSHKEMEKMLDRFSDNLLGMINEKYELIPKNKKPT
ncbi:Arc family DNA-binding protein [Citrobacter sp. Res13-Sevr-PEB04-36]|uniref:Arc family DNA-binding protein n=1 Tax=Citrobacter sp. Res13-Sevr-PEB04-36 TaxID=2777960 RepID=UPI0018ACDD33|nr:Arc family DNA-binding protein [Citrobacter sp. Res13-Sevr-PEB04-36]